ncbi:MAG: response regulator [Candidatus Krumholzibacteriia bacterium]|nr:response regulator [bacterium]MCB9513909.1 response regulator [Candidatus Latescibacterota bacterium]MCB9517090.1 response regulator [Candidatus Latescibacterota bacterium]
MKILCVDDDRSTLTLTTRSLQRAFPEDELLAAGSGEEAVDLIRSKPVDLLITDLMMPGLSGLDVLEAAKRERLQTEVIMVTAYSSVESAVAAMQKGARDYLAKPIHVDLLVEKVANIKELMQSRREIEDYRYAMAVLEEDVTRTAVGVERRLAELQRRIESAQAEIRAEGSPDQRLARIDALLGAPLPGASGLDLDLTESWQ